VAGDRSRLTSLEIWAAQQHRPINYKRAVKTKRTVTSGKWQVTSKSKTCHSSLITHHSSLAFTLIEVLVVVSLLSLIVFALMAVFKSTQTAFRASITQTDVLEGGRATIDLIATDLKTMTPAYWNPANSALYTNVPNFYTVISNGFAQTLPASFALYTNVMEDVFFVARNNQTWTGIGYFVRTNLNEQIYPTDNGMGNVASLYRYETNVSLAQFAANPAALYNGFNLARIAYNPSNGVSKILDGVMSFKVRAFDPSGNWLTNGYSPITNSINVIATNYLGYYNWGEVNYYFYSNALPASVEVELAILEDRALQRVESLPTPLLQTNYLANHAGQVHIFRQRILIPNADPAAYQ
jgi:type II secretory pathway pseudopilin PulG